MEFNLDEDDDKKEKTEKAEFNPNEDLSLKNDPDTAAL